MKNLLIYINPEKRFVGENEILIKIQIDNSLELGWKPKDILLVTNFDYEYNGVKSVVIGNQGFHDSHIQATKITALVDLFKNGLIKDEIYWLHDLDSYQLEPITEDEIGLGNLDAGFTMYGWIGYWCLGSIFIKKGAKDIFVRTREKMHKYNMEDEKAFRTLHKENYEEFKTRIKHLNITYNLGMRHVDVNYKQADKPIKIIHFHPWYKKGHLITLDIFMYGKNLLGFPLMNERLIKIFQHHGIK